MALCKTSTRATAVERMALREADNSDNSLGQSREVEALGMWAACRVSRKSLLNPRRAPSPRHLRPPLLVVAVAHDIVLLGDLLDDVARLRLLRHRGAALLLALPRLGDSPALRLELGVGVRRDAGPAFGASLVRLRAAASAAACDLSDGRFVSRVRPAGKSSAAASASASRLPAAAASPSPVSRSTAADARAAPPPSSSSPPAAPVAPRSLSSTSVWPLTTPTLRGGTPPGRSSTGVCRRRRR